MNDKPSEHRWKPDEETFQKLLEAAYVIQCQREERLAASEEVDFTQALADIVELQQAIHNRQLALQDALFEIAQTTARIVPADGIAIGVLRDGQLAYQAATGSAAVEADVVVTLPQAVSRYALEQNCILAAADAASDPHLDAHACRQKRIASLIAIPARREGQVSGVLEMRFISAFAFQSHHVQTGQLLAGLASEAIARASEIEWKQALAVERATMIEALEQIKPQLERLMMSEAQAQPPVTGSAGEAAPTPVLPPPPAAPVSETAPASATVAPSADERETVMLPEAQASVVSPGPPPRPSRPPRPPRPPRQRPPRPAPLDMKESEPLEAAGAAPVAPPPAPFPEVPAEDNTTSKFAEPLNSPPAAPQANPPASALEATLLSPRPGEPDLPRTTAVHGETPSPGLPGPAVAGGEKDEAGVRGPRVSSAVEAADRAREEAAEEPLVALPRISNPQSIERMEATPDTSSEAAVCRTCGHGFDGAEVYCGICGTARSLEQTRSGDIQSKWASLWRMQQAANMKAESKQAAQPSGANGNLEAASPDEHREADLDLQQESLPAETPAEAVAQQAAAADPWSSAASARDWLESMKKGQPSRVWVPMFWIAQRANIYLVISAILLLVAWFSRGPMTPEMRSMAHSVRRKLPPEPQLTFMEKLMVNLGLAEAPDAPPPVGNPNTQVWVDLQSAQYYCPGADEYGKGAKGKYTTQKDAQGDSYEPAYHKVCD